MCNTCCRVYIYSGVFVILLLKVSYHTSMTRLNGWNTADTVQTFINHLFIYVHVFALKHAWSKVCIKCYKLVLTCFVDQHLYMF